MSKVEKDFPFVMRYIRRLRGGSQPILAEASDGLLYVVKFTNNLQGPNLPFNESIGSELYSAFGLTGPAWTPLMVTDSFLDYNPNCWMQTPEEILRPLSGLCFASRFLGGEQIRLLEILPGAYFKRVTNHESFWLAWMIDICARHTDNRQAIFLEGVKGGLQAYFVDHGHLFGGPNGDQQRQFLASRYLDPRIYQSVSSHYLMSLLKAARCLDVDRLWHRIQGLPDEWKVASALDGFAQCLERLSNRNLLQNIVDTMVDAQLKADEFGFREFHHERNAPVGVLRPGIQAKRLERILIGACADRHARAEGQRGQPALPRPS